MIALHILSLVLGVAVTLAVLGSALQTVVLPQEGFSRLSQAVFAASYRLLVHRRGSQAEVRSLRALYAPVSLVSLPLVWMILMVDRLHASSSGGRATWPSSWPSSTARPR